MYPTVRHSAAYNPNIQNTLTNICFLLILFSSLLARIKLPYLNLGIHFLLLPIFSSAIIFLNFKYVPGVLRKQKPLIISLTILYLWMWISSFVSPFQTTAIAHSIKYSTYFILFSAFLVLTYKKKNISFYYRSILYLLYVIVILGFVEALSPELWIFKLLKYPSFYPQIGSIMQNPNQFGVIMAIGLCVAIMLERKKIISQAELYVSEFLFIIALALSASRNSWLVFLFGIFLLLIYRVISIKKMLFIISMWLLLVLFLPVSTYRIGLRDSEIFPLINLFLPKSSTGVSLPDPASSAISRFALWKAAISETIKRPFTGTGIGTFAEHIGVKVFGFNGFHAHNIYLNVLTELGIPGLIIFFNFLRNLTSKVKFANPIVIIPILMFLVSQTFDFFVQDYTFTTIEFYFLAIASNSRRTTFTTNLSHV